MRNVILDDFLPGFSRQKDRLSCFSKNDDSDLNVYSAVNIGSVHQCQDIPIPGKILNTSYQVTTINLVREEILVRPLRQEEFLINEFR